ncbi:hypothetical protein F4808DRAFT_465490 [Astrocystis sublimbata]|nr:hypothetical protein F4808DRAFT_465490 [Astrocystis sublimbata]
MLALAEKTYKEAEAPIETLIYDHGDDALAVKVATFGDEIRATLQTRSGYDNLSIFYNYARGDETLEQIYGKEKLPRLAKLKKTWDPHNVFAYNHPLPTHYP